MTRLKYVIPILILLMILLCAIIFISKNEPSIGPMEEDIYTPAAQVIEQGEKVCMDVTIDLSVSVGGEAYTQKHNKQIILQNHTSSNMTGLVTGSVQYGTYSTQITEVYSNDRIYLTVNDSRFQGAGTKETFLSQLPSVRLLTPENYHTITVTRTKEKTELSFTQPSTAEDWAIPEGAQMITAAGSATMSPDGSLQAAAYEISYIHEQTQFDLKIRAQYPTDSDTEIQVPDASEYTELENVYAPVYLEQTYGYLEQSKHLQAKLSESIFSEVDPIYYDRNITLERSGNDATVQTQVELTDNSRGGQISSYSQTETFRDGSYSIITNGEESDENSRINSQDMNLYCTDLLTSNILSPAYVIGATEKTESGILYLTFSAGEALAETVCQKSCETIYQNPAFLDSMSESYSNYTVEYYLTIDPVTGLPLSSGLDFSGDHTVEGIRYTLTTRYEQTYSYSDS